MGTPVKEQEKVVVIDSLSAYEQGFIAGLTAYAVWNDGEQTVGSSRTPLKQAIAEMKETWNYSPPER